MKWYKLTAFVFITALVLYLIWIFFYKMVNKSDLSNKNVQAFLRTIRFAEGTNGPNGYRTMYTGKLFTDLSKHPNINNCATSNGKQLCSTAAGAYQFLFRTWEDLRKKLNLKDFSPESQDLAALQLIYERGALPLVKEGKFAEAVAKVRNIWASLPGAGYGQPEKQLADLANIYQKNGGTFTA